MQCRLASNTPSCPPLIQFTVLGSSITHIQNLETSNCWQSTNENRSPLNTQTAPRCPLLEVRGVSKAQAPLRVDCEGRKQSDAAISAASHLCTLLGASTEAPCWTRASGGSPPLCGSQPLWGGPGKNLPFLLGSKWLWWLLELDLLLLSLLQGTGYLKKLGCLIHPFQRMKAV